MFEKHGIQLNIFLYCVNAIVKIKCMLDLFPPNFEEETAIHSLYKKFLRKLCRKSTFFNKIHNTLLAVLLLQIE